MYLFISQQRNVIEMYFFQNKFCHQYAQKSFTLSKLVSVPFYVDQNTAELQVQLIFDIFFLWLLSIITSFQDYFSAICVPTVCRGLLAQYNYFNVASHFVWMKSITFVIHSAKPFRLFSLLVKYFWNP